MHSHFSQLRKQILLTAACSFCRRWQFDIPPESCSKPPWGSLTLCWLAGSVGAGGHSRQLQPPRVLYGHLTQGRATQCSRECTVLREDCCSVARQCWISHKTGCPLLLGRGQEPTAQHLLSADKRINLVTNNRAIKPFIWLAFCCQLPGKSSTQRTNKAVCSHLCHLPHSSVLACTLSQAVWLGSHQVGGRSRFGNDGEVKTPGDVVCSRGCPYAHCREGDEGSAHPPASARHPPIPPHRAGTSHVALQTAQMYYRCLSCEA